MAFPKAVAQQNCDRAECVCCGEGRATKWQLSRTPTGKRIWLCAGTRGDATITVASLTSATAADYATTTFAATMVATTFTAAMAITPSPPPPKPKWCCLAPFACCCVAPAHMMLTCVVTFHQWFVCAARSLAIDSSASATLWSTLEPRICIPLACPLLTPSLSTLVMPAHAPCELRGEKQALAARVNSCDGRCTWMACLLTTESLRGRVECQRVGVPVGSPRNSREHVEESAVRRALAFSFRYVCPHGASRERI